MVSVNAVAIKGGIPGSPGWKAEKLSCCIDPAGDVELVCVVPVFDVVSEVCSGP